MRVDLLQVRDARYEPPPWYEWVLVNVDSNEAVGYFKKRHDAEAEMLRWLEEDEEE